ncbi:MAG: matrixin family metalloprotease [Pseudomonadota bacterium]
MTELTALDPFRPEIRPPSTGEPFALQGFKWGGLPYGTPGGLVTYAIAPLDFGESFGALNSLFDTPGASEQIARAFQEWSDHGNIQFQEVTDPLATSFDISFAVETMDGPGGALASADVSFNSITGEINSATIVYDVAEEFDFGGGTGPSFFLVTLHEIGHALGLDHVDDVVAVMNSTTAFFDDLDGLTENDIAGIEFIYGPSTNEPAEPPVDPGSGEGGEDVVEEIVEDAFESVLFDEEFYLFDNPDVAAAGLDPKAHYDGFGRHEGRDPSALFDTSFYLEEYADVAAADINPLVHYEGMGAAEGRDPNQLFDSDFYLEQNPDVAAIGINPLAHYEDFGWLESRNPSAAFDGDAYLAANPDVVDSGANPLAHYLQFGLFEGREIFEVDLGIA